MSDAKLYSVLYAYDDEPMSFFYAVQEVFKVLQKFPDHSLPDITLLKPTNNPKVELRYQMGFFGLTFHSVNGPVLALSEGQKFAMSDARLNGMPVAARKEHFEEAAS